MKYVYAVGRVDGASRDIVIVPAGQDDFLCDAFDMGTLDAQDGAACDPLRWFSDVARVEQYIRGHRVIKPSLD